MPGRDKLQQAMAARNPTAQRLAITPVDIIHEADTQEEKSVERGVQTETTTNKTIRKIERKTERKSAPPTLLEERVTVRDSFEVYTDQLDTIEELRKRYKAKTGRPLPKSRIVREALDRYLAMALEAYPAAKEEDKR